MGIKRRGIIDRLLDYLFETSEEVPAPVGLINGDTGEKLVFEFPCQLATVGIERSNGNLLYGHIGFGTRGTSTGRRYVRHAVGYSLVTGYLPSFANGEVLDHLCQRTLCWEGTHVRLTNQRGNVRNGKARTGVPLTCSRGHILFTEAAAAVIACVQNALAGMGLSTVQAGPCQKCRSEGRWSQRVRK